MGKYYELSKQLSQEMMYKFIKVAEDMGYRVSIETYLDNLKASDMDGIIEELLNTYEDDFVESPAYYKIGFLCYNEIPIECITIMKGMFRFTVYPGVVHLYGDLEQIRFVFRNIEVGLEDIIGEEIRAAMQ